MMTTNSTAAAAAATADSVAGQKGGGAVWDSSRGDDKCVIKGATVYSLHVRAFDRATQLHFLCAFLLFHFFFALRALSTAPTRNPLGLGQVP